MMHDVTQPRNATEAGTALPINHEKRRRRPGRRIVGFVCWGIGFAIIVAASVIIHGHPAPWPWEVDLSRSVQSFHLAPPLLAILTFLASLIDPVPSSIALLLWFAFLLTFSWFRQAAFLVTTVSVGNAIDALIGDYVKRPRPSASLIHIEGTYRANSFPSGHCAHTVLYYGALLYLSFSEPVRRWRYRWLLIPLQIFAALNILLIGFERIYQGEHWITDVLGGTLDGLLWLSVGILLYTWIPEFLERRRAKKQEKQAHAERLTPPIAG
ncbi:MAG TPA: phosphatase PAP2 family protein [Ktedonobacteraceae bacterium]